MSEATILAVAPNGAYKTRDDHPAIPFTPGELAEEAAACLAAGASMLHLHVREEDGTHSLDPGRYREALAEIRARTGQGLLLQITTESAGRYSPEEQRACVRELMPEAASLGLRELMPDRDQAEKTGKLLHELIGYGSIPQLILYEPGELLRYRQWQQQGLLPREHLALLFVLGRYRPAHGRRPALQDFLELDVSKENWMVCAFGDREYPSATAAARLGGHARIGFENNLQLNSGHLATSNAELVEQLRAAVETMGKVIADADQCRRSMAPRQPRKAQQNTGVAPARPPQAASTRYS